MTSVFLWYILLLVSGPSLVVVFSSPRWPSAIALILKQQKILLLQQIRQCFQGKNVLGLKTTYRISANSFRGNYLFFFEFGLMYCDLWLQYIKVRKLFKGGNYSRAETIHGNTVVKTLNCTVFWWSCPHPINKLKLQNFLFLVPKHISKGHTVPQLKLHTCLQIFSKYNS